MSDIIINRTDNIDYLQYKRLLEYEDKLTHAIFLKSHNCGFNLLNDVEEREKSIENISTLFNIKSSEIVQSHQIHSDNIMQLKMIESNILDGYDAFVSNTPNIASIITFADCIPIFIYDCRQNVYANIHAGWRGVVNGIILKTIDFLIKNYNSNITNLICCIGPNIRKECFLVNEDLVKIYTETFKEVIEKNKIIEKTDLFNEKGQQYRIDNNTLIKIKMQEFGILNKNIVDSGICTVCDSNEFHSRRIEGINFQKNGGLMMIRKN